MEGLFEGLKTMLGDNSIKKDYEKKSAEGKTQFNLRSSIDEIENLIDTV